MPNISSFGFDDPNMMAKLAMDPRTRAYFADPSYVAMVKDIKDNPSNLK